MTGETITYDPLTVRCELCDRRVRIWDDFVPWVDGIAHARCAAIEEAS